MSNKITFKEWLANLWKGVWQALCWIGRAFNPKYKTAFWRVVWTVITICVLTGTCIMVYEYYSYKTHDYDYGYPDIQTISHNYKFEKRGNKPGSIVNIKTGEVAEKDIDWIAISPDEDSLMVFSRNGKRGYINRFNGKVSIPAKYEKAWIFSSGVAGVYDGINVYFINHSGIPINDKKIAYNPKNSGYVYHGDYCAVAIDNGDMGLIDKQGNWAVEPIYNWITAEANNYWKMRDGGLETGLWYGFNDKAEQITDIGYKTLSITEDLGVVASLPNHLQVSYGFDGVKRDDFIVSDINKLYYESDERNEECSYIMKPAKLMKYTMADGYEGLCSSSGLPITEPLYWKVSAINNDTYLCSFKDLETCVIINSKGEIVKQQNL